MDNGDSTTNQQIGEWCDFTAGHDNENPNGNNVTSCRESGSLFSQTFSRELPITILSEGNKRKMGEETSQTVQKSVQTDSVEKRLRLSDGLRIVTVSAKGEQFAPFQNHLRTSSSHGTHPSQSLLQPPLPDGWHSQFTKCQCHNIVHTATTGSDSNRQFDSTIFQSSARHVLARHDNSAFELFPRTCDDTSTVIQNTHEKHIVPISRGATNGDDGISDVPVWTVTSDGTKILRYESALSFACHNYCSCDEGDVSPSEEGNGQTNRREINNSRTKGASHPTQLDTMRQRQVTKLCIVKQILKRCPNQVRRVQRERYPEGSTPVLDAICNPHSSLDLIRTLLEADVQQDEMESRSGSTSIQPARFACDERGMSPMEYLILGVRNGYPKFALQALSCFLSVGLQQHTHLQHVATSQNALRNKIHEPTCSPPNLSTALALLLSANAGARKSNLCTSLTPWEHALPFGGSSGDRSFRIIEGAKLLLSRLSPAVSADSVASRSDYPDARSVPVHETLGVNRSGCTLIHLAIQNHGHSSELLQALLRYDESMTVLSDCTSMLLRRNLVGQLPAHLVMASEEVKCEMALQLLQKTVYAESVSQSRQGTEADGAALGAIASTEGRFWGGYGLFEQISEKSYVPWWIVPRSVIWSPAKNHVRRSTLATTPLLEAWATHVGWTCGEVRNSVIESLRDGGILDHPREEFWLPQNEDIRRPSVLHSLRRTNAENSDTVSDVLTSAIQQVREMIACASAKTNGESHTSRPLQDTKPDVARQVLGRFWDLYLAILQATPLCRDTGAAADESLDRHRSLGAGLKMERKTSFHAAHAASAICSEPAIVSTKDCWKSASLPLPLLELVVQVFPDQVHQLDERGRLPLHYAAAACPDPKQPYDDYVISDSDDQGTAGTDSSTGRGRRTYWSFSDLDSETTSEIGALSERQFDSAVDLLIRLHPVAAAVKDSNNHLPLHLAIASEKRRTQLAILYQEYLIQTTSTSLLGTTLSTLPSSISSRRSSCRHTPRGWQGVHSILAAYPEALDIRNPNTNMYPFMEAAATGVGIENHKFSCDDQDGGRFGEGACNCSCSLDTIYLLLRKSPTRVAS